MEMVVYSDSDWANDPAFKFQVANKYAQRVDGSVEPRKIHTFLSLSRDTQNLSLNALRSKEVAGFTRPEDAAPSMEDMIQQKTLKVRLVNDLSSNVSSTR